MAKADRDGAPKVAHDLGLAKFILYNWQTKRLQTGLPFENQKIQLAEMASLKRENGRLLELYFRRFIGWAIANGYTLN